MRTTTARAGLTALALTGLLGLSGCSAIEGVLGAGEPERDDATGEITEAGEADAFAITVGDCLNTSELGTEVQTVPTVPCGEPHEGEVFAAMDLPEGDFPGEEAVTAESETFCRAEFETFIGLPYDDSALYFLSLYPTAQSWEMNDDREILCIVEDSSGKATGSLAGAAR